MNKEDIIERGLKSNPNMILNPDEGHVEKIFIGLEKKGGYCPCVMVQNEDTICPCKKMREDNKCCCRLYLPKE